MKTVLLGVSGGIAAYKAAEIVRALQKRGYDVRVYTDLSVPVSEELGKAAVERMRQAGVTIIEGDEYVD